MDAEDPVVSVIPIHFSDALDPAIHLQQFPLLTRPLEVPPSAAVSGKQIRARYKPKADRFEIHVPVDVRKEVWNAEKGRELGEARAEEDALEAGSSDKKSKAKDGEPKRLGEVRMASEKIPKRATYMLGVMQDGKLHFHPIAEVHQFRPTLTYLDVLSTRTRRRGGMGDDSDSDDGPPPDPDDPLSVPVAKKEKKVTEAKEVQVTAKRTDEKGQHQFSGGMNQIRKDMLIKMRDEAEEKWEDLEFVSGEGLDAEAFTGLFSKEDAPLLTKSTMGSMLTVTREHLVPSQSKRPLT